ncbi:MAG: hypothetical protein UHM08_04445 [Bacteroidales bacterium]|jgi:hypothetical protein|nr:hypothetical protein [Bacteroidales bacterium]
MQVILENLTTKYKQYFPDIEVNTDNPMYFTLNMDLSHLQDGEYQLTIYTDDNKQIGEEIIRLGEFKAEKTQYKVEKKFTTYVRK